MENEIDTIWGHAKINHRGYFQITTSGEYHRKELHRIIYESIWGKIPRGCVIHHIDGDKTNNCILNLQIMSAEHHSKLHNYNVEKPHSLSTQINMSKVRNSSGYFRVTIRNDERYSQGFVYEYWYYENKSKKCLKSVDIDKLKEKVLSKGLDWFKLNGCGSDE